MLNCNRDCSVSAYLNKMRSYRKRPSRLSSALAVFVGIGMLIFAFSQFTNHTRFGSGRGLDSFGGGFTILWGVVLVGIIGYHAYNAMTGKGYSDSIDMVDDDEKSLHRNDFGFDQRKDEVRPVEARLKGLSSLRDRDLISDDEFAEKRSQILRRYLTY